MAPSLILGNRPANTEDVRYESDLKPGAVVADKDGDYWMLTADEEWWIFNRKGGTPEPCGDTNLSDLWEPYTLVRQGGDDNGNA